MEPERVAAPADSGSSTRSTLGNQVAWLASGRRFYRTPCVLPQAPRFDICSKWLGACSRYYGNRAHDVTRVHESRLRECLRAMTAQAGAQFLRLMDGAFMATPLFGADEPPSRDVIAEATDMVGPPRTRHFGRGGFEGR